MPTGMGARPGKGTIDCNNNWHVNNKIPKLIVSKHLTDSKSYLQEMLLNKATQTLGTNMLPFTLFRDMEHLFVTILLCEVLGWIDTLMPMKYPLLIIDYKPHCIYDLYFWYSNRTTYNLTSMYMHAWYHHVSVNPLFGGPVCKY